MSRGVIAAIGIALSLVFYLQCVPWDLANHFMIGGPFGRDFVNFWEGGRLALTGRAATLSTLDAYNHLVASTFGHVKGDTFIFSYPPHSLLVLAPLAALPYGVALVLWTAMNLVGIAATCRKLAGPSTRNRLTILACVSPAALMMIVYGHFGGAIAWLMAIAILDGERRPIAAGLCLAVLTVKPQFAALLGVILMLAGRWRCLPVAALATAALVGMSAAIFGLETWRRFLVWTLPEQSLLLSHYTKGMLSTVISIYGAARAGGVPAQAASYLQLTMAVAAISGAVYCLRRGADRATTLFVVPLATIIALPYANHYDLAIVAAPLTGLLFEPEGPPEPGSSAERAVFLASWLVVPLTWQLVDRDVPLVPVILVAALAAGVQRVRRCVYRTSSAPTPSPA